MIRAIHSLAIVAALSVYLAIVDVHYPLPKGLIWRGGHVLLDDGRTNR